MKYLLILSTMLLISSCGGQAQLAYPDCHVEEINNESFIVCGDNEPFSIPKGEDGINGTDGMDGTDGIPGTPGNDGSNGINGRDGSDGSPGLPALIEVIDPCGQETTFDEILFRMQQKECTDTACSNIFAVYSNGTKVHLTALYPGTYQSTDGTLCLFTVTEDLDVVW